MPKYLIEASYTAEGAKGIQSAGGSARLEAVTKLIEDVGGTLEAFYFSFGDFDQCSIIDVPDNASVVTLALAVTASGAVNTRTTVLLTPEEVDAAARRSVEYRVPGS
jgi:uncharacterized protein with GYD domain